MINIIYKKCSQYSHYKNNNNDHNCLIRSMYYKLQLNIYHTKQIIKGNICIFFIIFNVRK